MDDNSIFDLYKHETALKVCMQKGADKLIINKRKTKLIQFGSNITK